MLAAIDPAPQEGHNGGMGLAFLEFLRIKFGLGTARDWARYQAATWQGRAGNPLGLVFEKTLKTLGVLVCLALLLLAMLGLRRAGDFLLRTLNRPAQVALSREDLTRQRREAREALFPADTNAEIQKQHDAWQARYGDDVYRDTLKPLAARKAVWNLLQDGNLTPTQIREITREAESEFLRGSPPQ